mmetsp:Transcript_29754/g.90505  ORF Transcript_29754/g.90505 Transcript_29754/m.90505 type:complete len:229 (+) Transcript_29754:1263-1949(+)
MREAVRRWRPWHRHAPRKGRARDGEVAQSVAHEGEHLVAARGGADEVRVGEDVLLESLPVAREAEEVRRLGHPLHLCPRRRVAVDQLLLGVEALVPDRVPPLVRAEVQVPRLDQRRPERRRSLFVPRLGGPDELVGGEVVQRQQRAEGVGDAVGKVLRRLARLAGRLLHLLAVLVRAGQKEDLVAVEAREAGDDVAGEGGVHVADVRLPVHVIDRRRYEPRLLCHRRG